jgi:hypothetical protein
MQKQMLKLKDIWRVLRDRPTDAGGGEVDSYRRKKS